MPLLSGAVEGIDCSRRRALAALKQHTFVLEPELEIDWPGVFQIQVLNSGVGQGAFGDLNQGRRALAARRARVVWEHGGGGFRLLGVGRRGPGAEMGSPGGSARPVRVV